MRKPDRNAEVGPERGGRTGARAPCSYLEWWGLCLTAHPQLMSRKHTSFVSRRAFQPGEEPPLRKIPHTQDSPKHSRGQRQPGESWSGGFGSVMEQEEPTLHSQ